MNLELLKYIIQTDIKVVILDTILNYEKYLGILENSLNKINCKIVLIGNSNVVSTNSNIYIFDKTQKIFLNIIKEKLIRENYLDLLITTENIIEKNNDIYRSFFNYFRKKETIKNIDDLKYLFNFKLVNFFINFKPKNVAYGGGNQFALKLIKYLENFPNINIKYELCDDIDIYFLIDIRRDRNREFKKYSFEEIYNSKCKNPNAKIIYRINDCDITRDKKELENLIVQNIDKIDYFVFNSNFIKSYYSQKYPQFISKKSCVIYNTSDGLIYYPKKNINFGKKIRIVTHHWSENINKGYEYYHKFNEYCKTSDKYEFLFIGRKFNEKFHNPPTIYGPYKDYDLAELLRSCDIYISASIYDSCPMHISEGISCGLPVLYLNHEGGLKDLCELSNDKIGEKFNNFDELIVSLEKIINNYQFYYENILKNLKIYNSDICYKKYYNIINLNNLKMEENYVQKYNINIVNNNIIENILTDVNNNILTEVNNNILTEVNNNILTEVNNNILTEVNNNILTEVNNNILTDVNNNILTDVNNNILTGLTNNILPEVDNEKYYIIMGTTSINRPELHNIVLSEWIDWIYKVKEDKKKYELIWFINIDIVKNLEDTYENTMENFKKIIKEKSIKQFFLKHPDNTGNFFQACKRIANSIENYVLDNKINGNFVKILWLEDDWKLNSGVAPNINDIINNFSGNLTYINFNFIRNNYIWALAPSILSYNLWKIIQYSAWMEKDENIDPESCVGLYYKNKFGNADDMYNFTVINKKISDETLTSKFMTNKNSFYTYFYDKQNFINDRYIEKSEFLKRYKDIIIFVRLTPGIASDYGRQYLQNKNIVKTKNSNEFYKII